MNTMCRQTLHHRLVVLMLAALWTLPAAAAHGALVSHWKLNETTGAAIDSVGSNNGTVGAGVTQGAAGQIGTSYSFPGTSGANVNVADSATLKPASFTVSAWVNTTDSGAFRGVIDKLLSGTGGYAIDVNSGNTRFLIYSGGFATIVGPTVNNGAWHMLTGTYDAGTTTMTFYVDGTSQGTQSTTLAHTTEGFFIGGDGLSTNLINGRIDDVGFWNEALPAGRVLQIYGFGLNGLDLETVPVPEPSTAALLGLGCIGLACQARRRVVRGRRVLD